MKTFRGNTPVSVKNRILHALKQMLNVYDNDWRADPLAYYAKTFVMFQSSETGKLRLAHEAGKSYLAFPLVFPSQVTQVTPPGISL